VWSIEPGIAKEDYETTPDSGGLTTLKYMAVFFRALKQIDKATTTFGDQQWHGHAVPHCLGANLRYGAAVFKEKPMSAMAVRAVVARPKNFASRPEIVSVPWPI
jgi:hypothetical protein